jgi:predicted DNA-binding mobile mystery protein A
MTTRQLADRLGVSQPRVTAIERAEQHGSLTLASLEKVADALDCTLVYAFVPRQSLEASVRRQAYQAAGEQIARVDHSMRLENQGIDPDDLKAERERLADEMLHGNLRRLWDTP